MLKKKFKESFEKIYVDKELNDEIM